MRSPELEISAGDDTRWVTWCRPFIFSWFYKNQVVTPKYKASHIPLRPIIFSCPINRTDVPWIGTKQIRLFTVATLLRTLVREIDSKMTISHYIILNHMEPSTNFTTHHTYTIGPYQPTMTESDPPWFHSSHGVTDSDSSALALTLMSYQKNARLTDQSL